MTILQLSPASGNLAIRDVAEVAVALLLGLLSWQGKKLMSTVETMRTTLEQWSVVFFGYKGDDRDRGLRGKVEDLDAWRQQVTQLTPEEVGRYDRRSSFRDAVERAKEEQRREFQHERQHELHHELQRLTPHSHEG